MVSDFLFGSWSPYRIEIEGKKNDLKIVNNAIEDIATIAATVSSLLQNNSNLFSQINNAFRVPSSSEHFMIGRIKETVELSEDALIKAKNTLEADLQTLQKQESSYITAEKKRKEDEENRSRNLFSEK